MIIKKGEREYSVTELSHEWTAERVLGGVAVEYKITKEAAPAAAAARGSGGARGVPERATDLFAKNEAAAKERWEHLNKLVEMYKD